MARSRQPRHAGGGDAQGIPWPSSLHRTAEELTNLARAALAGSREDPDSFLKACWQYAYAAAIRFGRKHSGSEDSAQDAVLAVHGLLQTTPPELKPETVGALVSVLVLRSARAVAERRMREAGAAPQMATGREAAADPAHDLETAEWAQRVREAVKTLPQPLRRLVELRYWDDLSTREIARELGRSQSSVMRLLTDAETALHDELRGLDDAHEPR